MKRKMVLLCIIAVLLTTVAGCWNRREMNELAIAVGMGLDKVENGFQVSFQVVDTSEVASKKGNGYRTPVTMYAAKGDTIFEAMRRITKISPRKIYPSHLRVLVLGESLAREGIKEALDIISRDWELRMDFYIMVAKGTTANNVLKILTPLEKIPVSDLYSSMKISEKSWAPTLSVTLDKLITELVSEGKHSVLTGVEVIGNQEKGETNDNVEVIDSPAHLKFSGLAVFKRDTLIGWLNETESIAYTYTQDKIESTVGAVPCSDGGKIVMEVVRSETNMKGNLVNGTPQINIEIRDEENVGEVACKIDLTKIPTIYGLEEEREQKIKKTIENSIHKVQKKYKVDIFGFGEVIHRSNPKEWKTLKKDWNEVFIDLKVNVKVDVKIRRLGTMSNSFINEIKE